ncbi:MAG: outer membrane protein FlgP [Thermotogota bacterium]|nr:outer membrane protein FlgP [Thermotogota bacterium]MDK2865045.1 outer membrane protein FlgP [Thermotogota bacterium]HCZ06005.1 hypothetical protein [Thermotogota bacterium]
MKKRLFIIFLTLMLFLLTSCGGREQQSTGVSVSKETGHYWDFVGYAPIIYKPGDNYTLAVLKAKDVAINEAYTLAVKTLMGFTIAGGTKVEDYMLQKKISIETFSHFVRGFQVVEWREDRERLMVVAVVRVYKRDLDKFLGVSVVTPPGIFEALEGE